MSKWDRLYVRIVAAEALGRHGGEEDVRKAVATLVDTAPAPKNGAYVCLRALIAIDSLGARAKPMAAAIKAIPVEDAKAAERAQGYPARVMRKLAAEL